MYAVKVFAFQSSYIHRYMITRNRAATPIAVRMTARKYSCGRFSIIVSHPINVRREVSAQIILAGMDNLYSSSMS